MFRYPGGKSKVKKQIFEALKEQRQLLSESAELREPFLGGGAITLHCLKEKLVTRAWLNDLDPGIASIWNCALNDSERFVQKIQSYNPDIADFQRFKDDLTNVPEMYTLSTLERAFRKLVVHQFSYSGLGVKSGGPIGGKTQVDENGDKKKYSFDCRWSPKKIVRDIQDLQTLVSGVSLRHDSCTQLDYRVLLEDEQEALIYLDPPYYEQGEALYQFYFTEEQHVELSEFLKATPHRWVLSYDNHPRIRELYSWANISDLAIKYSITGANDAKEVIIVKD